jgi:hypothetical protein
MRSSAESGLTLLEVVIAILLFALMCVLLVSGQGEAADSAFRAQTERDMAYLLPERLKLVALDPDDYKDGEEGEFPAHGKSSRLVDEEKVFGNRYPGYRWRLERIETVGAGASEPVRIEGLDGVAAPLFAEEGGGAGAGASSRPERASDIADVKPEDVDRMLFLRVTIFPPGYDPSVTEEGPGVVLPKSAWTAIPRRTEEAEPR